MNIKNIFMNVWEILGKFNRISIRARKIAFSMYYVGTDSTRYGYFRLSRDENM